MSGRGTWRAHALAALMIAGVTAVGGEITGGVASAFAQAPAASPVAVRFGSHPTYDRLVFDFPDTVGYRVEQQGSAVTLVFDGAGPVDESQLTASLGKVGSGVSVAREGATTRVSLQMADGLRLRHFRSGPRVVVDFSRTESPQATAQASPPPPARTIRSEEHTSELQSH